MTIVSKLIEKKVLHRLHLQTLVNNFRQICMWLAVWLKRLFSSQRLEELVAYLRDQVQDIRVRSNRQGKFVNSCAEQLVCQGLKLNSHKEKELEDEFGVCLCSRIILCPWNYLEHYYSNALVSTQNVLCVIECSSVIKAFEPHLLMLLLKKYWRTKKPIKE